MVLPLTSIGVLLRTTSTARGIRLSTTGISTTTANPTPTTCVQCGRFDLFFYFSILIFLPSGRNFFSRSTPAHVSCVLRPPPRDDFGAVEVVQI